MKKLLFVCSANRDRSPTAAYIYNSHPGIETKSAGVSSSAYIRLTVELLDWADVIFCMEEYHEQYIRREHPEAIASKKIHNLALPDYYEYMEPRLVSLIKERMEPLLAVFLIEE